MSDGYWTDERRMMQEAARDFTSKEVLPVANALDPEKGQIPRELIDKMAQMGYFGVTIPEDKGGLGLGCFEYCLIAEELAQGWMSVASLIARGNGFWRSVPGHGAEREEKIARMAAGQYLGAFAMSEPNTGSDMAGIACRATRDGDDWVISGNKYWCTFADGADFISVVCRVDSDTSKRQGGMKSIAVEKPRGELPAGVQGSPIPKIGYHGWKTWELHFDNVRVPALDAVDGDGENKKSDSPASMSGGFVGIQRGLEVARAHTAARSIGAAQGALNVAIEYANEREQFGQPIGKFQAIRFKIATAATEIEAARQLMYHVCNEIDQGAVPTRKPRW